MRGSRLFHRLGRVAVFAVFAVAFGTFTSLALADRAFTPRFPGANDTGNVTGNITMVGNTLETCPVATSGCTAAQRGTGSTLNNNNWTMQRVDVDGDPATTLDSSMATLTLPAGATVLFAGLYYGAATTAGTGGTSADAALRNTVKLKVPRAAAYTTLTASVLDISESSTDGRYQGFVDVTSRVAAAGNGDYWVGDVQEATGEDRYGGWALVVAYRDPTQPARNLTVFDGLQSVTSGSPPVTIPLTGFRTPPTGPVRTTLGAVVYEGDLGTTGDSLTLNTSTLSDATNPADNFFNSAISAGGVPFTAKDPNHSNQLGFDAVLVNADGKLPNGATSANITLKTSRDQYFPGVVTFATELFAPSVQTTKSVANVTHPGGPHLRGDTLRYTVTFVNTGQDGADDFVATDVIPAGATYVPSSLRIVSGPNGPASPTDALGDDLAEFEPAQNHVVFRLGAGATASRGGLLAASGLPGSSASITFDVTIDGNLTAGSRIVNSASAQFLGQSLGTPLSTVSPDVVTTVAAPDLTIAKSHSPEFVAGAPTTFTLGVRNAGTSPTLATPVTVTDSFPAGAAGFDSITVSSAPGWNCAIAPGTTNLTCTRSDVLAAGASYPAILVTAVVHNPAPANLLNTAFVAGGGDSDPTNNSDTDVAPTTQAADLAITKTVSDSVVPSGGEVTFDLTVDNNGPSTAAGVTLNDVLGPAYANVTVTTSQGTCATAVSCTLGSLAPGGTATVTITATVAASNTTLVNTATVNTTTPDPVAGNNSASDSFVVPASADLQLTKTIAPATPTAGVANGATYTITVRNAGPDTATSVDVVDPLPPEFTPSSVTAPGFTCNLPGTGGTVVCSIAGLTVAAGPQTIAITGTFAGTSSAQIVFNSARIDSTTADAFPDNNADQIDTLVIPAADLSISKFSSTPVLAPGDAVTFTLTLVNNGPSPAAGVTVTDALPSGFAFVSASSGCSESAGSVGCSVGSLAAGATSTITITARATGAVAGQTVTNTSSARTTTPDPVDANNSAVDTVTVTTPSAPPPPPPTPEPSPPSAPTPSAPTIDKTTPNEGPPGTPVTISGTGLGGTTAITFGGTRAPVTPVSDTEVRTIVPSGVPPGPVVVAVTTPGGTATTTFTVLPPRVTPPVLAALSVKKTADRRSVRAGSALTFTITVSNRGTGAARQIAVCDRLPRSLVFVRARGARFRQGQACWQLASLAAGKTVRYHIRVRAVGVGRRRYVMNTANVNGDNVARCSLRSFTARTRAAATTCRAGARIQVLPARKGRAGGATG